MTPPAPQRAYPVARSEGDSDPRFTFGLVSNVAKVLQAHGYPPLVVGADLLELHIALFHFLYGKEGGK
ncbi:hypothetical protein GCM10012280_22760 [Wenjunlia tyrosinilytica]|uniref:Uncharacterized protein n=1 Tax=Wenjunlia tyrosinilytica TaxID=1544741 RepID=A0A918DWD1_9ACTN|nr:hypothetical protein GCM10012280_22760 [Wenjunlia tyrosinilytica]